MQWQFIFYLPFKIFRNKFYFPLSLQRPHVLACVRKHNNFFSPVQNETQTLFCRFFVFVCFTILQMAAAKVLIGISYTWFWSWETGNAMLHNHSIINFFVTIIVDRNDISV